MNRSLPTQVIPVQDSSQIGDARRAAQQLAQQLGFSEADSGKLSIIVNEAASNFIKHAGPRGGEILLQQIQIAGKIGIELLALDWGPGMSRLEECLRDGFSSAGTQGIGLGGIRRQSASFDIFSSPGKGTVVMSRLWSDGETPADPSWIVGGITKPVASETICGDAWGFELGAAGPTLLVADGLGHGPAAHEASIEAVQVLHGNSMSSISQILKLSNSSLRKTRGAAVAIMRIDPISRQVYFAGVGNIAGAIVGPEQVRSMVSMNGIVGHECRKIQEFTYEAPPGSVVILHSDGLQTRWDISRYPGLLRKHPSIIAAVLYRDFTRGRDDVTVVVLKETARNIGIEAA